MTRICVLLAVAAVLAAIATITTTKHPASADQSLYPGWNPGVWQQDACVGADTAFANLIQSGALDVVGRFAPEAQRWEIFDPSAPAGVNTLNSVCGDETVWLHVSQTTVWQQSIQPSGPGLSSEQWEIYGLINSYRASSGSCYDLTSGGWRGWYGSDAQRLALSPTLTNAAQGYSQWMIENDFFGHTDPYGNGPGERIGASGYRGYSWAGEILAAGQQSAQEAFDGWRGSDGHNRIMLSCNARAIGVGQSGSGYATRWVGDFGNYVDGDLAQ